MTTFVDTSAFVTLLSAMDPRHREARDCFDRLRSTHERLVTHSYVLAESIALVHRRHGTDGVRRLDPLLAVAETRWVDETLHWEAYARVLAGDRRGPSLVDRVSFAVMRQEGLSVAFAFDRDFAAEGFEVIPG